MVFVEIFILILYDERQSLNRFFSCRTPLVRLNTMSAETGCEILAKAEFCNGGGSVKDRAALFLIKQAERDGTFKGTDAMH